MSQASNNQLTRLMKSIALTLSAVSTGLWSGNDGAFGADICGRRDRVSVLDTWAMTCIVNLWFISEPSVSQCKFTLLSPVCRRLLHLRGCVSAPTSRGRRCRPGELCCYNQLTAYEKPFRLSRLAACRLLGRSGLRHDRWHGRYRFLAAGCATVGTGRRR